MEPSLEKAAAVYIPEDWRQALARGVPLPETAAGAALVADISGFTSLTETLALALGLRLGAEELSRHLNQIYETLIGLINDYGGSVVSFAGDSITCWFDNTAPAGHPSAGTARAAACALQMQSAMEPYASVPVAGREPQPLKLKIAIASGDIRRILAGDPAFQRFAILSGEVIARVAAGEAAALGGEILLDEAGARLLGEDADLTPGPTAPDGTAFWNLAGLRAAAPKDPWPPLPEGALREDQYRPWLLPQVFQRLQGGLGDLITEIRPAAALFLRFQGVRFEEDPQASQKLDDLTRQVQAVLARYEGALMGVTVSDKGSDLYATFGAPIAHEDTPRRALLAALALLKLRASLDWLEPVQIGISQGMVWTGAYGGPSRRAYGVLGDDVNLASRLMSQAAPGEILISGRMYKAAAGESSLRAEDFSFEPRPPVTIRGKADPVAVFAVTGSRLRRAMRLQEPAYALPMVGRREELALIEQKIDLVLQGKGQVVGICAQAGIGKSRLLSEAIRAARRKGLNGYGGACQADGTNTPYLVWKPIWQGVLNIDPGAPLRRQMRVLEGTLEDLAPEREEALPLLGPLLGLSIPENDFSLNLDPQLRHMALVALLIDCLQNLAGEEAEEGGALMLVIEDLHWADPASLDLLEHLVRAVAELPVLLLLAYRPALAEVPFTFPPQSVAPLPYFTEIHLRPLAPLEIEQAARAKLAQIYPEWRGAAPRGLIDRVIEQSEGNPFYAEELLNYLHDQDMSLHDIEAAEKLELPSSLQNLILSRLDQLTARQQLTLKVASIIGRLFRFDHLHGYYPALGESDPVRKELERMEEMELTRLDTPEPELTYLFRHFITHEVAYENLPASVRAGLHEQYARYLEDRVQDQDVTPYLDLLAHHYNLSNNLPKKRLYLRNAAAWAAGRYANTEAFNYLTRALPLASEEDLLEKWALLVERETVLDRMAVREIQRQDLDELARLAVILDEAHPAPTPGGERWLWVALRRASFFEQTGDSAEAVTTARQAIDRLEAGPAGSLAPVELADLYARLGSALLSRGEMAPAQAALQKALDILPPEPPHRLHAGVAINLGILYASRGDLARAAEHMHRGLVVCEKVREDLLALKLRNNLGLVYTMTGDWSQALVQYNLAQESANRMGVVKSQALTAMNMGLLYTNQGAYSQAMQAFFRSLELSRLAGLREGEINDLINLARVSLRQGDRAAAQAFLTDAIDGAGQLEGYANQNEIFSLRAEMRLAEGDPLAALEDAAAALALARENELEPEAGVALRLIGQARAALGQLEPAQAAFQESIQVLADSDVYECARSKLLWAAVLRQNHQPQPAAALLAEARATFQRLGARADLEAAQRQIE